MSRTIFLCYVMALADALVQFEACPPILAMDGTSSLIVNCTFSYDSESVISDLISMIISKREANSSISFHDLVAINTLEPDLVQVEQLINSTASGHIDDIGLSYLSLHWTRASVKEAGIYRCMVNGVDSTGRPVNVSHTVQVTAARPNLDQLIELVKNQQAELDLLAKTMASVGVIVNNLVTSVNAFLADALKRLTIKQEFQKSVEYYSKNYFVSRSPVANVSISQARCEEIGGYLAEMGEMSENNFVKDVINMTVPDVSFVLTGGRYVVNSSQWIWQYSQSPFSYKNWDLGEPSQSTNDHCLYLNKSSTVHWSESPCDLDTLFVCEV